MPSQEPQIPELRVLLPTGTLYSSTRELFGLADMSIRQQSDRQLKGWVDDPPLHIGFLRPQDIPGLLSMSLEDCGICGLDCVAESGLTDQLVRVCDLEYGMSLDVTGHTKLFVIARRDDPAQMPAEIKPGSRLAAELPTIARQYFGRLGIEVVVLETHGSTESWVANGWVDYALELVESGTTLDVNELRALGDTPVLESNTALFANPASWAHEDKREAITRIGETLTGVLNARGKAMLVFHAPEEKLPQIIRLVPTMRAPTISQLGGEWQGTYAVTAVVPKKGINSLIRHLRDLGATDFVEVPIQKVLP